MECIKQKFILALLMVSCHSFSVKAQPVQQGIKGNVLLIEGNVMPSPNDTSYIRRVEGVPVEREIFIYKLTHMSDVVHKGSLLHQISSEKIGSYKTDTNGLFSISLPPGKYTLLVKEGDGFFVYKFDGKGNVGPVEVAPGTYTDLTIRINNKAYY